jgi:Mg2+ and Co2+ transporter CorA
VEKSFPEVRFEGSDGLLVIDYEKMMYDRWSQPLYFGEVASFTLYEGNRLQVTYDRDDVGSEWIDVTDFGDQQQAVLDAAVKYHARFAAAARHQQYRQKVHDSEPADAVVAEGSD